MQQSDAFDILIRDDAERRARTRRHADGCVLMAVVTSTDVAAALIDRAVALHGQLGRVAVPA